MHVEITTYVMTGLAEETNRGRRDGGWLEERIEQLFQLWR